VIWDFRLVRFKTGLAQPRRLLSIGTICINQTNQEEKLELISKMNLIYEGAQITIVNAAGDNAESGLPGVLGEPRPSQPRVVIGGRVIVSSMTSPRMHIGESVWQKRGWTFQEGVLSRRLLIFTKEQVYWECNGMWQCESMAMPLSKFHTRSLQCFQPFVHRPLFSESTGFGTFKTSREDLHCRLELMNRVFGYSTRKLTHSSDTLNAMEGIVSHDIQRSKGKIRSLFGWPVDLTTSASLLNTLAFNICCRWFTNMPSEPNISWPGRKPQFPSWSWAGWHANGLGLYEHSRYVQKLERCSEVSMNPCFTLQYQDSESAI
jgi:Heterokaryon incompatibility protein (HET)